ncbi:MAG: hypothetical protein ACE5HD_07205 [Acidobacteriota bacterium]
MRGEAPLPRGTVSFDLPFGPLRVRIVDLPTLWDPFVTRCYRPFARPVQEDQPADLTVVCRTGRGIVIPLPGPGGTPVVDLSAQGAGRYRIRSHWQDGQVNVAAGRGEILLTHRGEAELRMSLENYLRVATQILLTGRGAFLIHSAGLLEDGRCFLFFGHSGAGKSTVTELSAPRPALSDDMVLVDTTPEPVRAHAVPFFGVFPAARRVRGAFPVAGAFRLRQDRVDRLVSLSPARGMATLAASVPFLHDLGLPPDRILEHLSVFCRQIPVHDLHFTRSGRFWELIQRQFAPPGAP